MQRSLWHGAISFGLIYVPVDMYSAAKDGGMALHLLDSRDFAPVGYQRINKTTGKEVDWAHIVKGYEYEKGQYVALSDADFRHANVKATETIEIRTFSDAAEIPAMYFETPYYLAPKKGGEKVYSLLRQALQSSGKVAVASFVMRGRQHLCAVAPNQDVLMLLTLRFPQEILPRVVIKGAGGSGKSSVTSAELSMAKKLIEQMSGTFNPSAFEDSYRADLMSRVREKIRKKQTHSLDADPTAAAERPKAQVIDLMEALKNSLKKKATAERNAPKRLAKAKRRA
jgi:DNA end-binding protein Ku